MRALVTGSAGFVGRHMVAALRGRGHEVWPFDLPARDILKGLPVDSFDLAVHCAYRVGGRRAIDGARENLAYNLALDATFFRWAEVAKPGRVLYFSSSAAYPVEYQSAESPRALHESMIGGPKYAAHPDADYGWAKLTGERLAANYAAQGRVVHVVRPFSGYGADQSPDYPFPTFVARAKRCQVPFEVWGDPTSVRDWVHIDDVVAASLAVVDADCREPVNVCTGRGASFLELATLCMRAAGYEAEVKSVPGPEGVHTRVGDPSRMLKFYTPKVSLEEGVRRAFA